MLSEIYDIVWKQLIALGWHRSALTCLVLFVVWRIFSVLMLYSQRPKSMRIEGKTLLLGKWVTELDFILKGADRIVEKAEKLGHVVFAIPALSCYQILVSSQKHIIELSRAGEDVMSFRAAMNERLFFKHTMFGFELNDIDPHDAIPRRVAKILVRENLPKLGAVLKTRVKDIFDRIEGKSRAMGNEATDPIKVSAFDLSKTLIARMNNQLLFGDELAEDDEFESETVRYAWHTIIIMQILRQVPSLMVPVAAKLFMAWSGSMHKVGAQIQKLVIKRLEARNQFQGCCKEYLDGTEWVISSSQTPAQRNPARIVQQMVALLFASMHQMQMATTWAIVDLCIYREYIEPLRAEIYSVFESNVKDPYDKLYLMDSFLRESSRLNPLDGLTVQRKALKSFTFSDGSYVPAGNLVAVPQRVVMQDPERYPDPQKFDPFRFMHSSVDPDAATTKYADVKWDYTFWGSPRKSCPGRWYASYALKHVLVHLLLNYDLELSRPDAQKYFIWTTAIVPRTDMYILLKTRTEESVGAV